jgi:signal transduction histidine kinase
LRWRALPLWLEISAGVLLILVLSNVLTLAVAEQQRVAAVRAERLQALEARMAAFVALYRRLPPMDRDALERVAGAQYERLALARTPRIAFDSARDFELEDRLRRTLQLGEAAEVRPTKRGRPSFSFFERRNGRQFERYAVAVALGDGWWLNAEFYWPIGGSLAPGLLLAGLCSAVLLVAFSVWLAQRLARPLAALAQAAARAEMGETVSLPALSGPGVLQEAVDAFNRMTQRLLPLVDAQKTVLASVGHDLRTPLTALRLKSEFIDDDALRQSLAGCIDEIQSLTEAALRVAGGGVGDEPVRRVELSALVSSLCADLAGMGADVTFIDGLPVCVRCRPGEVRRAVRNVVENAVKHAGSARVRVTCEGVRALVVVEDEGPGLPVLLLDAVFEPFRRAARDGVAGHGLGLTLARAVARAHGGDVQLSNRAEGGLRAVFQIAARD